jgi:hypothetical protein
MMSPSKELLEKIAKLKAHAESAKTIGSEAEAEAFAAKVNAMLLEHKLSMTDVEMVDLEADPIDIHLVNLRGYPDIKRVRRRVEWQENLAAVIADAHFCRIMVYPSTNYISFVGRKSDAEIAEYMWVTMVRAAQKLAFDGYARFTTDAVKECRWCKLQKKQHRQHGDNYYCIGTRSMTIFEPNWAKARGYKESFLQAFITRLFYRFREERQKAAGSETAMVRLGNIMQKVAQFVENQKTGKAGALGGKNTFNAHGQRDGKAAADRIGLQTNALESANIARPKVLK